MALRFRSTKDDDVAVEVRAERRDIFWGFVCILAFGALYTFVSGESLRSYEETSVFVLVAGWLAWILAPRYIEISIRTRETHIIALETEKRLAELQATVGYLRRSIL